MFHPSDPIGILDSGIGGFSVVRQVQRTLPGEELVYFGDGAHIPYGNHPEDKIVAMARYMFRFMEDHHVKALLVACNTISCVIGQCEGEVSCPTFNAVQAGAEAAARLSVDKIGVISTVFTHNSRCYPEGILARSPKKLVVLSCGCPDLARLGGAQPWGPCRHGGGGGGPAPGDGRHSAGGHPVLCAGLYPLPPGSGQIRRLYPVCPSSTPRRRWPAP